MGRHKPGKPRRRRLPRKAYVVPVRQDDAATGLLLAEALLQGCCPSCSGPVFVSTDGGKVVVDHVEGCAVLAEVRATGVRPVRHGLDTERGEDRV